jgi:hypothetical protein
MKREGGVHPTRWRRAMPTARELTTPDAECVNADE